MQRRVDVGRWGAAALRSLIAGGCWLGCAVIVSMGEPLVVVGALAGAVLVGGGVTWSAPWPTPVRLVLTATVVVLARFAAGPMGAAIALSLFIAGAFLRVRVSDGTLGLALFAGAVSFLGGADARLLAAFVFLGAVTVALLRGATLVARWTWPRLLARERPSAERLAGET